MSHGLIHDSGGRPSIKFGPPLQCYAGERPSIKFGPPLQCTMLFGQCDAGGCPSMDSGQTRLACIIMACIKMASPVLASTAF